MTELHKSDSKHKFYLLNTIFGISLFFFVISSFWMFNRKSQIFRKGMIATVIGIGFGIIFDISIIIEKNYFHKIYCVIE